MKVKLLSLCEKNDACLNILSRMPNKADIIHSNLEDGHYTYHFELEGTEEEIKTITEFCNLLNDAEHKIEAE